MEAGRGILFAAVRDMISPCGLQPLLWQRKICQCDSQCSIPNVFPPLPLRKLSSPWSRSAIPSRPCISRVVKLQRGSAVIPRAAKQAEPAPEVYVRVERGDSLHHLALKFDCHSSDFVDANEEMIRDHNVIYEGDLLKVPSSFAWKGKAPSGMEGRVVVGTNAARLLQNPAGPDEKREVVELFEPEGRVGIVANSTQKASSFLPAAVGQSGMPVLIAGISIFALGVVGLLRKELAEGEDVSAPASDAAGEIVSPTYDITDNGSSNQQTPGELSSLPPVGITPGGTRTSTVGRKKVAELGIYSELDILPDTESVNAVIETVPAAENTSVPEKIVHAGYVYDVIIAPSSRQQQGEDIEVTPDGGTSPSELVPAATVHTEKGSEPLFASSASLFSSSLPDAVAVAITDVDISKQSPNETDKADLSPAILPVSGDSSFLPSMFISQTTSNSPFPPHDVVDALADDDLTIEQSKFDALASPPHGESEAKPLSFTDVDHASAALEFQIPPPEAEVKSSEVKSEMPLEYEKDAVEEESVKEAAQEIDDQEVEPEVDGAALESEFVTPVNAEVSEEENLQVRGVDMDEEEKKRAETFVEPEVEVGWDGSEWHIFRKKLLDMIGKDGVSKQAEAAAAHQEDHGAGTKSNAGPAVAPAVIMEAKVEDRSLMDQAIRAAIPAVTVGLGTAAALSNGVNGGLEAIGLVALASFITDTMLWAEKRKELLEELKTVSSPDDLLKFLRRRGVLPPSD
eukprot:TRINITY_DN975_c0_g1_i6.p1 TRINITY_DN975_c0_g1~~TRINITY_DN975_c0_g1_i6.p1  ORF type:complete len:742 (-),score=194.43 TRINITY_DN975_c0_g1_i6:524-2749(-)